jgi:hypothetical protein
VIPAKGRHFKAMSTPPDNSFDLPTGPRDLDPEWLTFLESLPIGPDEEEHLFENNMKPIAAFILDKKIEDDSTEEIVKTLAFWTARNRIQQDLLEKTPNYRITRGALASFDKSYQCYTNSIRKELWRVIEAISKGEDPGPAEEYWE